MVRIVYLDSVSSTLARYDVSYIASAIGFDTYGVQNGDRHVGISAESKSGASSLIEEPVRMHGKTAPSSISLRERHNTNTMTCCTVHANAIFGAHYVLHWPIAPRPGLTTNCWVQCGVLRVRLARTGVKRRSMRQCPLKGQRFEQ
jgi:hypothetical protein